MLKFANEKRSALLGAVVMHQTKSLPAIHPIYVWVPGPAALLQFCFPLMAWGKQKTMAQVLVLLKLPSKHTLLKLLAPGPALAIAGHLACMPMYRISLSFSLWNKEIFKKWNKAEYYAGKVQLKSQSFSPEVLCISVSGQDAVLISRDAKWCVCSLLYSTHWAFVHK